METSRKSLKVLHVPCNTPYVKKLSRPDDFDIINGRTELFPEEIKFADFLKNSKDADFWDNFDVCHIHYGFEFEKFEVFHQAIQEIRKKLKPIVYTCHELNSVHGIGIEQYKEYLNILFQNASELITLTEKAKEEINIDKKVHVIPHGQVTSPIIRNYTNTHNIPNILLLGTLRENRDLITSFINLNLGTSENECNVSFVTKPFTSAQIEKYAALRTAIEIAQKNTRNKIETLLPLQDKEFNQRVSQSEILVLPYSSAGHSGQLELAFDLGIFPIVTNVGFIESQIDNWPKDIAQIIRSTVVDWTDGKEWLYQSRLIKSVKNTLNLLPSFQEAISHEDRDEFRKNENTLILNAHSNIYNSLMKS
jgi:hypothetical protein